jgi:hypothetical protein
VTGLYVLIAIVVFLDELSAISFQRIVFELNSLPTHTFFSARTS